MEPQSHESLPIVTSLWGDIGRGVAAGAGLALLCTVLLSLAIDRGARDLPASPRSFLIWYWAAGLACGGVWGTLRRYRTTLARHLLSGAILGVVIVSPLGILIPLDERSSIDWRASLILALAGVPAGVFLGFTAWLRKSWH